MIRDTNRYLLLYIRIKENHTIMAKDYDLLELIFATAFRGNDLTDDEEFALYHLLDMMTAVKQQVLLRKALYKEDK